MKMINSPAITLGRVSCSIDAFDGTKTILKDVDLTVQRNEWTAIVGANGSGKSTLAKVLANLFPVSSGTVAYSSPAQPAAQLIFQNPEAQIIGETVYEDVIFGMENYGVEASLMHACAGEALRKVGLASFKEVPAAQLSGGQKQLLAIAGVLAVNPSVLVFDEATSMLDPLSREVILRLVRELHREGKTIVWITQLLDELAWCERVVAVRDGSIVFDGTNRDFFYGGSGKEPGFCTELGFIPPFTVQAACDLLRQGFMLSPLPLTPAELGKAVSAL